MRANCEIPEDNGVTVRVEGGRDDCPMCQWWFSEGCPGLDTPPPPPPRVGEGVFPAVFSQPTTTCERLASSEIMLVRGSYPPCHPNTKYYLEALWILAANIILYE